MSTRNRIPWIDCAKAYGMILVFYGHFVETLFELTANQAALMQYKFIYSFHMPLFFVLSGYVSSSSIPDASDFFSKKIKTRVVPVLFFNFCAIPLWVVRDIVKYGSIDYYAFAMKAAALVRGHPKFNGITWFIICLMMVEVYDFLIVKYLKRGHVLRFVPLVYLAGWLITWELDFFSEISGIGNNFWYIHEAIIAYPFYYIGKAASQGRMLKSDSPTVAKAVVLSFALLVTLLTFDLNTGFGNVDEVVMMTRSQHGNLLLFPTTAIAGSAAIILLAQLTPQASLTLFIGRNTLFLMGLNGIIDRFFSKLIIGPILPHIQLTDIYILLTCTMLTVASLAACYPAVLLLNRHYPRIVNFSTFKLRSIMAPILN